MNLALVEPQTVATARERLSAFLQASWSHIEALDGRICDTLAGDDLSTLDSLARAHSRQVIELAETLAASDTEPELQVLVLRALRARNGELQLLAQHSLATVIDQSSHAYQRHAGVNSYQEQQHSF